MKKNEITITIPKKGEYIGTIDFYLYKLLKSLPPSINFSIGSETYKNISFKKLENIYQKIKKQTNKYNECSFAIKHKGVGVIEAHGIDVLYLENLEELKEFIYKSYGMADIYKINDFASLELEKFVIVYVIKNNKKGNKLNVKR
ncbi:hypothetical protein ACW95P_01755 [Candidatus Mycoplasma pogonae]